MHSFFFKLSNRGCEYERRFSQDNNRAREEEKLNVCDRTELCDKVDNWRATSFLSECARSQEALAIDIQLPGLRITNHFDDFGWPVSHVWDSRYNQRKPELSFALYLASDMPSLSPGALYTYLRQEAPEDSPWSLDIIWNADNLSAALQHYSHVAHLWPRRRATARGRLHSFGMNVFRRAAGHILPEELLQRIEGLAIPDYANEDLYPTYAPTHNVFLYLDLNTLGSGPVIVTEDLKARDSKMLTNAAVQQNKSSAPRATLEIMDWRSWATVSERLIKFWSLPTKRK